MYLGLKPYRLSTGFTLVEILIVLAIIGITLSFALLSYGDFGARRRLLLCAEQLQGTLALAQQQALLENSTLGLRINANSYQILKLHPANHWLPLSHLGIFKTTYFPKNTLIHLKIENPASRGVPAIFMNAAGDMTPFTLDFSIDNQLIAVLRGEYNGRLDLVEMSAQ